MKLISRSLEIIFAGIVASVILSAILFFYKSLPTHIENKAGNTDYVWSANSHWMTMAEGISWGKYDANGFNNKYVIENPDILLLGSSHMEATNVMQDKNTGYLLNQKLNGKYTVYNMGVSGHNFYKICKYLPANLSLYERTPKAVIIETSSVSLSEENINQVLNGTVDYTPSYTGIMSKLQKIPLLRVLYHQIDSGLLDLFMPSKSGAESATADNEIEKTETQKTPNLDAYDNMFKYIESLQEKHKSNIIILYHPHENLNADGSITFNDDAFLETFAAMSEKYGITFINMADAFEKMYYEEHYVPHGFCNGAIGEGHLNNHGHAAIANSLYNKIIELEKSGKLCQ